MTLAQGTNLGQLYKKHGYALQARKGKVRAVVIHGDTITPCSNWMNYAQACVWVFVKNRG